MVLEGNGFCFPGSDLQDSFLHFQDDKILSGEQQHCGVYFPFFPHADTLDEMETILVPDVNNHNFSYKSVDLWKELQWYNPLWNIPYTSEWNECMDQMWWSAFYKHMDPYLDILKQHTEDPLIETIVELE